MSFICRLTLSRYCCHLLLDRFLVAQIVAADRTHIFIKLIDQGHCGRNIHAHNVLVGNIVQMLNQRTQRVAVSSDQNLAARFNVRDDFVFPVRNDARDGIRQALGQGKFLSRDMFVARVKSRPHRIVFFQGRRRNVVGASPNQHLFVAEVGSRFFLI